MASISDLSYYPSWVTAFGYKNGTDGWNWYQGFPTIKSQHEHVNNIDYKIPNLGWYRGGSTLFAVQDCVATAFESTMQIFEFLRHGKKREFSYLYLYGQSTAYEGMYEDIAMGYVVNGGMPEYSIAHPTISQYSQLELHDMGWGIARNAYNTGYNTNSIKLNALKYANNVVSSSQTLVSQYSGDNTAIKQSILDNGCTNFWLYGCQELYDLDNTSDGILADTFTIDNSWSHEVVVFGWKQINSKNYWVCQNSWGWYGDTNNDPGRFYIPFNHGCIYAHDRMVLSKAVTMTSFDWQTQKVSGGTYTVTADEWNQFTDLVGEALLQKGKTPVDFGIAKTGQTFTAAMFNTAKNALATLGQTGLPATQSSGNPVNASYFTTLKTALNNVLATCY